MPVLLSGSTERPPDLSGIEPPPRGFSVRNGNQSNVLNPIAEARKDNRVTVQYRKQICLQAARSQLMSGVQDVASVATGARSSAICLNA